MNACVALLMLGVSSVSCDIMTGMFSLQSFDDYVMHRPRLWSLISVFSPDQPTHRQKSGKQTNIWNETPLTRLESSWVPVQDHGTMFHWCPSPRSATNEGRPARYMHQINSFYLTRKWIGGSIPKQSNPYSISMPSHQSIPCYLS